MNVAQNKPAWQSSTLSPDTTADKATDGNPDPERAKGSCAVTRDGQHSTSWWLVDLEREYAIKEVTVVNIGDDLGNQKIRYVALDLRTVIRRSRF